MPGRRHSSTKTIRDRARDGQPASLDDIINRLAVVERGNLDTRKTLDAQLQRIAAIQAQLDHLAAKMSGR
jgi:hypothetical protein